MFDPMVIDDTFWKMQMASDPYHVLGTPRSDLPKIIDT
jgi:hypothetical protein